MSQLEQHLARWRQAGLLDAESAERIRTFEASRVPAASGWLARLALGAGGLMAAAGIVLFVAANWSGLSPASRSALLLGTLAALHLGAAAVTQWLPALATTLHAVGTAALGAAIFLLGQAYNLEADWPRGFLLWALGGWIGWLLLRSWPQLLFAAVLTPVWGAAEWADRFPGVQPAVPVAGLLLLAFVYLTAEGPAAPDPARRTLGILGAISLLPLAGMLFVVARGRVAPAELPPGGAPLAVLAFAAPLLLAAVLRRERAWHALVLGGWVAVVAVLPRPSQLFDHAWMALGGILVALSGVLEASGRRISVGFAGFALSVVVFYFASVLDRLGRATSLLLGGMLFLVVGATLERLRRRLVDRVRGPAA